MQSGTQLTGDIGIDGGMGLAKTPEPGRHGDWMQSWTGKRVYPADPQPGDIDILDIIYALSNMTRYNGHCRFYSVLEHSILMSYLVPSHPKEAFAHDFVEAYLSDIVRPVKRILGKENDWFKIDKGLWEKAIAPKFGLALELPKPVVEMDTAICITEKRVLHPRADPWYLPFPEPRGFKIRCMTPGMVFHVGLRRYCELWDEDEKALMDRAIMLLAQDAESYNLHQEE